MINEHTIIDPVSSQLHVYIYWYKLQSRVDTLIQTLEPALHMCLFETATQLKMLLLYWKDT